MADYVSSLTGVAMDAALLDMAEHTSEAYAIGERNGVPVGSDDVAYHNNARYYASQAQSIAPASVTEAVRWDVAQTALTDANRLQARENIKATSHNPNLLDNPWWGSEEVVNQRNVSTNFSGYCIDRWKTAGAGSFSLGSTGITITGATQAYLTQVLETKCGDVAGKVFTGTVLLSDGTIYSGTAAFSGTAASTFYNANNLLVYIEPVSYTNPLTQNLRFGVSVNGSATKTIHAVKLELGSFSTLAEDTPTDYGEELTRCIYSTADPTDTYANNGFGRTNPNLLDNPWFTVQQRGAGPFTAAAAYTADRWQKSGANGIVTPTANGLKFEKNGATYVEVRYYDTLDKYANTGNGKSFTLSILLPNGTVQHQSFVMASSGLDTNLYYAISSTNDFRVNLYTTSTLFVVRILCYTDFTLRAIKLEQGTVSTLANDTTPDYGTELLKCMRYFIRLTGYNNENFGFGYAIAGTIGVIHLPIPVPMRTTPTVSTNGSFNLIGAGAAKTVTAIGTPANGINGIQVQATSSSLTTNQPYMLVSAANGTYIDLSADL